MVAGLLLTGGASRRMGRDKAELVVAGERLADRSARLLSAVCDPVLEVGPGYSALDAVGDDESGAGAVRAGPLAALVTGVAALRTRAYSGAVVLLGVDLPFVTEPLIGLVAHHPESHTVVPVAGGVRQSCCARYAPHALVAAAELVERGERALRALLSAVAVVEIREEGWRAVAPADALADLDTPEDLVRYNVDGAQ